MRLWDVVDTPAIPALKIEAEAEDRYEFKASMVHTGELGPQHEILSIND